MSMSGVLSVLHEQVRCPTCYTWADQVSHLLYMSRSGVPPVVHARVMYPSCYIWAGQVSHLLYMSWSGVSPVIHEQVRCLTCCTMYMSRSGVSPVVHEQVRCPDDLGRNSDILYIAILWGIPAHVGIRPFLQHHHHHHHYTTATQKLFSFYSKMLGYIAWGKEIETTWIQHEIQYKILKFKH